MFQDVATKEWFQTSSILELKDSCRSWGDLSSNSLGNVPQLRQLPLKELILDYPVLLATQFETFQDMDIFDLSERFGFYKNYGQIIVGK